MGRGSRLADDVRDLLRRRGSRRAWARRGIRRDWLLRFLQVHELHYLFERANDALVGTRTVWWSAIERSIGRDARHSQIVNETKEICQERVGRFQLGPQKREGRVGRYFATTWPQCLLNGRLWHEQCLCCRSKYDTVDSRHCSLDFLACHWWLPRHRNVHRFRIRQTHIPSHGSGPIAPISGWNVVPEGHHLLGHGAP